MASSASEGKRCHYEVLGLKMESTSDEIRSAYKKLALQRHPDKLIQSGLSQSEATAAFQELVSAYEVLSDPKERAWYDSHRSQILFSDPTSNSNPNSNFPDLFSYFSNTVYSGYSDSGKGFFRVYADVFDRVYANEISFARKLGLNLGLVREAPVMGNLDSPYAQVMAFYSYWMGFCTVMDFCWVDQYDVMAGPNRKSRRLMEDENKKLRKKAKREYNDTVRGLAEYVKKRDKRVIDMQVKKGLEMEKKRKEERERKREMERIKMEKARAYEEPEWARVEDEVEELDDDVGGDEEEEEEEHNELYCAVCRKKFKSDKQWKNHEQSKKHKEKVAEFRDAYKDGSTDEDEEVDQLEEHVDVLRMDEIDSVAVADEELVGELEEKFEDCVEISEGENAEDTQSDTEMKEEESTVNSADDERVILESMLTGRRNRRKAASVFETQLNGNAEENEPTEYNNTKASRKNRNRKEKGNKPTMDTLKPNANQNENVDETHETNIDDVKAHQSSSDFNATLETKINGNNEKLSEGNRTVPKKPVVKKSAASKDVQAVPRGHSKGKKSKGTKASGNACEACGEEFESKNKLHRHLGETGHATLKHK